MRDASFEGVVEASNGSRLARGLISHHAGVKSRAIACESAPAIGQPHLYGEIAHPVRQAALAELSAGYTGELEDLEASLDYGNTRRGEHAVRQKANELGLVSIQVNARLRAYRIHRGPTGRLLPAWFAEH